MAAALRRGPARPGSESAVVPRLPSPARAPPSTCRAECDPSPPAARRPPPSRCEPQSCPLQRDHPAHDRGPGAPGRPRERDAAAPSAGDCRRDDGSKSRATRQREVAVAQPRLGGCDAESAGGGLGSGFCRELKLRTAVVSGVRRGFFSLSGLSESRKIGPARTHSAVRSLPVALLIT